MCACVTGGFERKYRPVPLLKVFQLRASLLDRSAWHVNLPASGRTAGVASPQPALLWPIPGPAPFRLSSGTFLQPSPALRLPSDGPTALPSPPALLASFVPTLCHRAASTVGSLTGAARSLCTVRTSACSSECRHRMRARALGRGRPCRHLGLAPLATPFRYRSAISATWVLLVIRLRSLTLSLLSQTSVRRL